MYNIFSIFFFAAVKKRAAFHNAAQNTGLMLIQVKVVICTTNPKKEYLRLNLSSIMNMNTNYSHKDTAFSWNGK